MLQLEANLKKGLFRDYQKGKIKDERRKRTLCCRFHQRLQESFINTKCHNKPTQVNQMVLVNSLNILKHMNCLVNIYILHQFLFPAIHFFQP